MKPICIIGAGYVGLVTGACFADLGNQVACEEMSRIGFVYWGMGRGRPDPHALEKE